MNWESTESRYGDVEPMWNLEPFRRRPSLHQVTAVVVPKAARVDRFHGDVDFVNCGKETV